ncbi:MAG TPA: acylneuraminate cytidylyltransferase family protein, partial [Ramlibacter sp.]|nr:acylneuraminate cytidylyltransferase family protein [Ramlibacter sp.]
GVGCTETHRMTTSPPAAPRILALILARGGSKRLPGKNLRPLCGKPLIAWSIEAALACPAVTTTVVSTDDQAIADTAQRHGARAPFLRPPELAQDQSTSADAALHAVDWLAAQGESFDAVLLLEPTSPLRASGDLAAAVARLLVRWSEVDAVVSVGRVQLEQPGVMKRMEGDGLLAPWVADGGASDATATAWFPYGVAYLVKTEALRKYRSFYPPRVLGHPIQRWQNYEVDDEFDFLCIESIMNHFGGRLP